LPPVPLQYHHFADYLERMRESDAGRAQRAFWQARLHDIQPLQLPNDLPREEVDARREAHAGVVMFPASSVTRVIPQQGLTAIERMAQSERVSVMSTLVAAMARYLSQRTSQRDLAFITRVSQRYLPGLERTLGFLVNPLLLRISTEGNPAFPELVGRTQAAIADTLDHGECDLLEIAPHHVFRFCLVYVQTPPGGASLQLPQGITATTAPRLSGAGPQIGYDLLLWLTHYENRIGLNLAYNLELFHDATAAAFLEGYVKHLEATCNASVP
jgi:non-ribosomal peptide synthetase component F